MNDRSRKHIFAGLFLSALAIFVGVGAVIPQGEIGEKNSLALLYRFAQNDELQKPNTFLASAEGKVIVADLNAMELYVYEGGRIAKTYHIISKGRGGTPWETPTGTYAIQTKESKHYSSIGGTWMPYSMQFYGNFFIHGWPMYSDGKSVPVGYSGGCIRLTTPDAEELYALTPRGTKLIVLGATPRDSFATTTRYFIRTPDPDTAEAKPALPTISATSFIVTDIDTGSVLWARVPDKEVHPAGLTNLPVALTALETVNQYKIIRMSELLLGKSVLRKHSIGALDEMPVGTLIYPLLFDTNDTAAKVFARERGTREFIKQMNEKMAAIGMTNTEFSGELSESPATTTARDLSALLSYVNLNKHFLIDVSLTKRRTLADKGGDPRFSWENKNPWVHEGDALYRGGVASVFSDGGGNALAIFDVPVSEFGTRPISFVVVGSSDLRADMRKLREFVALHFVYGIERNEDSFIREVGEPTPSLLEKAKDLLEIEKYLQDNIEYDRDA